VSASGLTWALTSVRRAAMKIALIPRGTVTFLLIRASHRSRVADFELVDATDDHSLVAEDQLLRSFNLIRDSLPPVYARMRRDVKRVMLLKAGGPEYWPFAKAIAFKKSVVERAEIPLLAMTLVHEATHARLWNNGIGYPVRARVRIEHLCVRAEVRLARELPDADELEKFAVDKLKNEWWTDSAVTARRERTRRELAED
jgi:hypothetical protein